MKKQGFLQFCKEALRLYLCKRALYIEPLIFVKRALLLCEKT